MVRLIIFDWDDVFTLGSRDGYYACYKEVVDSVGGAAYYSRRDAAKAGIRKNISMQSRFNNKVTELLT